MIVSNIALWIFVGFGMVLVIIVYYAGATIASGGTSSAAAIFDQMKSSPMLIDALASVGVLAPIPAGYIAAKIAPRAKILNGALSTSASIIFPFTLTSGAPIVGFTRRVGLIYWRHTGLQFRR